MISPAGQECRYYYADYFRGRERQECRLLDQNPESERWQPQLCNRCPAPGVLRANACPNLVLEGRVEKRLFGLKRQVVVEAICAKYLESGFDPHLGCGHCHEERPGAQLLRYST